LERLENRDVPGSVLGLSALGADLGALYDVALAPAAPFAELAQATRGVAVQAPSTVSEAFAVRVPALGLANPFVPQQALQGVQPQGALAAPTQALPGPQAAVGTDSLSQAVQAFLAGGKVALGSGSGARQAPQGDVIFNGTFSSGADGLDGWTVGAPGVGVFASGGQAYLGPVGQVNSLTQVDIPTPNAFYTISFDVANDGGPTNQFALQWNGADIVNFVDASSFAYTNYSATLFTAPFHSTLTIIARQDPSYYRVTNVSAV
jgi:hypothetical protein